MSKPFKDAIYKNGAYVHPGLGTLPYHQVGGVISENEFYRIDMPDVPTALFSTAGTQYDREIDARNVLSADEVVMRIRIDIASNPVVLSNVPHGFRRLQIDSSPQNSVKMYSRNKDTLLFETMALLSGTEKDKHILRNLNLGWKDGKLFWETGALPVGTHYFYLPIHGPWSYGAFPFSRLEQNLHLIIESENMKVSGSGTITCGGIQLLFRSAKLQGEEAKSFLGHVNNGQSWMVPYVYEISKPSETITASTEKKITISELDEKNIDFIAFVLRSTKSNTDNANYDYVSLGDPDQYAKIDVQNNNESLLGNNGIDALYLKSAILPGQIDTEFFNYKNVYIVPFCHNVKKALQGSNVGSKHLTGGNNLQLSITPSAAGTSSVITLTAAAGSGTDGNIEIEFNRSSKVFDWEETKANVGSGLSATEGALNYKGRRTTLTMSDDNFADTRTLTITPASRVDIDDIRVNSCVNVVATGVMDLFTPTVSTVGSSGFTTGTYAVDIYGFAKARVSHKMGKLSTTVL